MLQLYIYPQYGVKKSCLGICVDRFSLLHQDKRTCTQFIHFVLDTWLLQNCSHYLHYRSISITLRIAQSIRVIIYKISEHCIESKIYTAECNLIDLITLVSFRP